MIKLRNISKSYAQRQVIRSVDLTIGKGEIYGIIGESGAGKSTLLRIMNVLEHPDQGEVEVNGQLLTALTGAELRRARQSIGMIFQQFNLLANKTVLDNVMIPLQLVKAPRQARRARAMECLKFVGLAHAANKYPAQLSGGQKQRIAIARALANEPQVLLCDEPTSALDAGTTSEILGVLDNVNKTLGVTVVIVSHELDVIRSICNAVAVMADGEIYDTLTITPKGITQLDKSPQSLVDKLTKEGS